MSLAILGSEPWELAGRTGPELFRGFTAAEITRVTSCLGTRHQSFVPGQILAHVGEPIHAVGLVRQGTVLATTSDTEGNRRVVEVVTPGQVFGEEVLWATTGCASRTMTAAQPGQVLLIGMSKILKPEGTLCELRSRVVENLFRIMGEKNRKLQEHLQVLSHKSLRARLSAFLTQRAMDNESEIFTLTLNRAELAEHLNADRAALSRELSRMKSEGLIDYQRSSFRIFF